MKDETDQYIVKCKTAGLADEKIARKLGFSVEEVNRRFEGVLRLIKDREENGWNSLEQAFVNLCLQYQNVGEGLKLMGLAFTEMTDTDLRKLITTDCEETIGNLRKKAIVLVPFNPPKAEVLVVDGIKG